MFTLITYCHLCLSSLSYLQCFYLFLQSKVLDSHMRIFNIYLFCLLYILLNIVFSNSVIANDKITSSL